MIQITNTDFISLSHIVVIRRPHGFWPTWLIIMSNGMEYSVGADAPVLKEIKAHFKIEE